MVSFLFPFQWYRSLYAKMQRSPAFPLAWLIAPAPENLGFALRTTVAAFIALSLALWMEMDSPQWAAMTTWIVAQNSRGQSLSKAKWRLIGTCIGAVAGVTFLAAFPQEPGLVFPFLAIWAGGCCAIATFLRNFRSYALVLISFTTTIIVLNAANQPDNVFMIALSRTTYITLGIVCESLLAALFAPNLEDVAEQKMRERLLSALQGACAGVQGLLRNQPDGLLRSRALLGSIPSLADQTEFSEIEMGPHNHAGDHARASLNAIAAFLARGITLRIHMQAAAPVPPDFQQAIDDICQLLTTLPAELQQDSTVTAAMRACAQIQHYRTHSQQRGIDRLIRFQLLQQQNQPTTQQERHNLLEGRILESALAKLLMALDLVLKHYIATQEPNRSDHFRFDRHPEKDVFLAANNGLRSAAAICAGGLLWEVTAWPDGSTLAMFVAVTTTRFSSFEDPVHAASGFFRGAVWAAVVSFILSFVVLPQQAAVETLLASLFFPMLVGGLALRAPGSIAGTAAAYNNFLPFMVGPANQSRMDEITWLNTTPAVVLGIGLGIWVFRLVLPFDAAGERWRLRQKVVHDLRQMAKGRLTYTSAQWIAHSGNRLAQIIRHAGTHPNALVEAYLAGAMSAMTIGLLILRLRNVMSHQLLSAAQMQQITHVLATISQIKGYTQAPALAAAQALHALLPAAMGEKNLSQQIDLIRAIGALEVLRHEFTTHATFMDVTRRFHLSGMPDQLAA
ncbi:fusaric acid resistance protein FusB [Acetobacter pomorum]|uniref:Fusaric acid resistance protein FusB n=1 Tax=Acetobacter pomorum TaxID=65959 RepID=A0A2G4RAY7_9PROT|nr:FUSC family protein [Acetobacter pomorum]PHY93687.1 fusaric acid resistance protein FusB [Acetobacter pomorum]